ncbi:hypothetical protein E1B28_006657 [Marasmius oreades]|uniref:Uncharacterized protein n=1 Tax=Marasmius oreades TaxID=181124 RepID=A0A9P7UWK1_9AGAR|nr:uncharacterized protein E1B28_006657 [Marasmius oreades]KAG7095974.1 hypothetical protein E1B28_006657 [Marasmius oreades]
MLSSKDKGICVRYCKTRHSLHIPYLIRSILTALPQYDFSNDAWSICFIWIDPVQSFSYPTRYLRSPYFVELQSHHDASGHAQNGLYNNNISNNGHQRPLSDVTLPQHNTPSHQTFPSFSSSFFPERKRPGGSDISSLLAHSHVPSPSCDFPPPSPSPSPTVNDIDSIMSDPSDHTVTAGGNTHVHPAFGSSDFSGSNAQSQAYLNLAPHDIHRSQPLPSHIPNVGYNIPGPTDGSNVPASSSQCQSQPRQPPPDPDNRANASGSADHSQLPASSSSKGKQKASSSREPLDLLADIADSVKKRKGKGKGKGRGRIGRKTKSSDKQPTRGPGEPYRLLQDGLTDSERALLHCMFLWVRILWGLLSAGQVPELPTQEALKQFQSQFSSKTDVQLAHTGRSSSIINPKLVLLTSRAELVLGWRKNSIGVHATTIPESLLEHVRIMLSKYGIEQWRVNLPSTPYSLYNKACEYVALDSFSEGLVAGAFNHMKCPSELIARRDLHQMFYNHVVFHYLYGLWMSEGNKPGSVAKAQELNTVYQNRLRLANAREKFLRENDYPERYLILADPKATSDDELDPVTKVHQIKKRPERSEAAEIWYRKLDERMRDSSRFCRSRLRLRNRPPADIQKTSTLDIFPTGMPLDYYSPAFYKTLPDDAKRVAVLGGENEENLLKGKLRIAFLKDPNLSLATEDKEIKAKEKKVSDNDFFVERYEDVCGAYDLGDEFGELDPDEDEDVDMS